MSIKCGFFNSINGDRKYNATELSRYFKGLVSNGVLPNPSTNLQVMAGTNTTVKVSIGKAFSDGHWLENDSIYNIELDNSEVTLNRYDAIIIKYDTTESNRTATIEVKKGVPAITPAKPTMTRNDYVKEYCLAYIYVAKNTTVITQSNITDTRADKNVCGWVTGLIEQVDTSTLFAQWQTAYEEFYKKMLKWQQEQKEMYETWYSSLTEQLRIDTYIREIKNKYELTDTNGTKSVNLGKEYDIEKDILICNLNGITLEEGEDYTLSASSGNAVLNFNTSIKAGNVLYTRILKSVIGSNSTT